MCAGLFGDKLICGLRGESRRNWEVNLRYGVKKNHMITLERLNSVFFTYIITLYIYLAVIRQNLR